MGLFRCQAVGQAEIQGEIQNSESQPSLSDDDNNKKHDDSEPGELVELGSFTSTHGLRGELKFQAISDSIEERLNQDVQRYYFNVILLRHDCVYFNLPILSRPSSL